jgi:hypothetical protein
MHSCMFFIYQYSNTFIKNSHEKKYYLFILAIFTATAFAQLENTQWKTKVTIDGPVNVIFDFKKDTVSLYNLADSASIEVMSYTATDTSFTLLKIDGQSDCDLSTPGKYNFRIKNDSLFMKTISDNCDDRSSVINNTRWKKWKEHTGVKVDDDILKQYAGVYELDEAHPITIIFENGHLYAEGPNNGLPKSVLTAEGNNRFYLRIADVAFDFVRDTNGTVIKLISHEEKDYELKKVK